MKIRARLCSSHGRLKLYVYQSDFAGRSDSPGFHIGLRDVLKIGSMIRELRGTSDRSTEPRLKQA